MKRTNHNHNHHHHPIETNMIIVFLLLLILSKSEAIQVNTPPTLTSEPNREIFAIPEMMVEMPCRADGVPNPSYQWFKNGKLLSPSASEDRISLHNGGLLVITEPNRTDQGQYQCTASNQLGTAVSQISTLRMAELGHFRDTEPKSSQFVKLGGIAILDCNAPESVPDANIYWTFSKLKDGSGAETMIGHTSTETCDYNGRLYIISVDRKHVSDRFYICNAYNEQLGFVRKSGTRELEIVGTQILPNKPQLVWASDTNRVYAFGDTMKLKCIFAGNPAPKTIWKRQGGKDLPLTRFLFNNEGQELVIVSARPEDSGVYECHAFNEYGVKSHSMNVKVNRLLDWESRPIDMNVVPNTSVSFVCRPKHSDDHHQQQNDNWYSVQWSRNGRPLEMTNDPRWILGPNKLTIKQTTQNDTGVIQCNITTNNNKQYIHANAYLNVIAQPPSIDADFIEYEKVEGSKAILKCAYFAAPIPTLDWKFRRKRISSEAGRFKLKPSEGILEISNLVPSDAGLYQCEIENELGKATANRSLTIRRRTRIKIKPRNQDAKRGSLIVFRCVADHDIELDASLEWFKDNRRIQLAGRMIIDKSDQSSLKILSAQHADTGFYSCLVKTKLDNATAGASLLVQDVPEPPEIVGVECGGSKGLQARVHWKNLASNYAPVIFYRLQYSTQFAPDEWIDFEHRQIRESTIEKFVLGGQRMLIPSREDYKTSHIPSSQTDLSVNLTCWANITFRVIAYNRHGSSEPSPRSFKICETKTCAPARHPGNVKVLGHTANSLRISWTLMKKVDWNDPDFWYEVRWRPRSLDSETRIREFSKAIVPATNNFLIVNASEPYERHEVMVSAHNKHGSAVSGPPESRFGFSGEGRPRYIPTGFRLDAILDGQTALFTWHVISDKKDVSLVQGRIKGFVISHSRNECGSKCTVIEHVMGNVSSAMIDSLAPWADVTARIAVMNDQYVGDFSKPISFKMPEGRPGVVLNLKVIPFGLNGLKAMWKPPRNPHGNILGYFIRIRCVEGIHSMTDIHPHEDISDANVFSYIAGGLIPQSSYRFEIRAFTSQGRSESPAVGILTVGESKAPSKPRPRVKDITETSLNVTWNPFAMSVPGAMYFVKYRRNDNGDSGVYEYTLGETLRNFIMLYNLDFETDYEIILVATDGIKNGTFSDPLVVRTSGTKFTSTEISRSSWFIGVVVTISILLLLLVVVCMLIRERGISYPIREFEPEDDQDEDSGFIEYIKTSAGSMMKARSLSSRIVQFRPVEDTDEDILAADCRREENNQNAFGDDCSFVGQYGFPVVKFPLLTSTTAIPAPRTTIGDFSHHRYHHPPRRPPPPPITTQHHHHDLAP